MFITIVNSMIVRAMLGIPILSIAIKITLIIGPNIHFAIGPNILPSYCVSNTLFKL